MVQKEPSVHCMVTDGKRAKVETEGPIRRLLEQLDSTVVAAARAVGGRAVGERWLDSGEG